MNSFNKTFSKGVSSYTDPETGDTDVMDWRSALRRQMLPYGYAKLVDGRHVLFNRRFRPLYIMTDLFDDWKKVSRSTPIYIESAIHITYFYNDSDVRAGIAYYKALDTLRGRWLPVPDRSSLVKTKEMV